MQSVRSTPPAPPAALLRSSLDAAVGAVANAHAWDMLRYNYFSHTGRDGSTIRTRLSAAGIAYTHAGENICEYTGIGVTATLQWCHGSFMSEPYPGYFNHIANILDPDFRRVGIGIATVGRQGHRRLGLRRLRALVARH